MSCVISQEIVSNALQLDTAAFRSFIAGVAITAAQELVAEEDGAQLLLTTTKTNCGGTAEEEIAVRPCLLFGFTSFLSLNNLFLNVHVLLLQFALWVMKYLSCRFLLILIELKKEKSLVTL